MISERSAAARSGTSFVTRYVDVISHSIRSVSAWLLILLVVMPFTAPFSSCDISMLLGATSHHPAYARVSADAATTSIEAAMIESESGSVLEEEWKDAMAVPAVAAAVTDRPLAAPDRVELYASATRHPLVTLRL